MNRKLAREVQWFADRPVSGTVRVKPDTVHVRWSEVPDGQDRYARRAREATLVRTFCPGVVPGLLQTPAYTRWLCAEYGYTGDVDALVAGRRERQELLGQEGRRFELLTSTFPGGWHVNDAYRLPGVEVRARRGSPFLHTFTIYDQSMVEIELEHGELTLTAPEDVAVYVERWDRLWAGAARWERGVRS